jgi:hypothetical protein
MAEMIGLPQGNFDAAWLTPDGFVVQRYIGFYEGLTGEFQSVPTWQDGDPMDKKCSKAYNHGYEEGRRSTL